MQKSRKGDFLPNSAGGSWEVGYGARLLQHRNLGENTSCCFWYENM